MKISLSFAAMTALAVIGNIAPTSATPTTNQKIGQMIMVGFTGTAANQQSVQSVLQELREGSIGGVILTKDNIVSRGQLRRLTSALKQAARNGGQLPPFIAVDQEGGAVQRLKFTRYPSARRIARKSLENAGNIYRKLACELRATGINLNFGPVADLDLRGRANPIIGRMFRSYGKSPDTVITYARQFIVAHNHAGVMTAVKHFPGHGSSLKDSHKGRTAIPAWNRLGDELSPFAALAANTKQGIDMMMIGHLSNKAWEAPASLSYKAVTGMLRQKLNFTGVAITDDMEMGAIAKNYSRQTAVLMAVNAGNDILLYANTINHQAFLGRQICRTISTALCRPGNTTDCIKAPTINRSYQRIIKLKHRHSLNIASLNATNCP